MLEEEEIENPDSFPTLKQVREKTVSRMEAGYLRRLVRVVGSDAKTACEVSGLSRARLYELLKKHGVSLK